MTERKVNFFLAGSQKTATTWLYNCFKEHPDIFVPEKDAIHYFSINYFRGHDWYDEFYKNVSNEKVICDPTPSYIREQKAAERIYQYNPEAKLLFSIRNPIDRAFSHYWHQKRKGRISYSFQDAIHYNDVGNIDFFINWVKAGFYYELLKPFFEVFPRDQIHIAVFENLKTNPEDFLSDIFNFMEVDSTFKPGVLNKKLNASGTNKNIHQPKEAGMLQKIKTALRGSPAPPQEAQNEYQRGISAELREELKEIFAPENKKLEKLIGQSLKQWDE